MSQLFTICRCCVSDGVPRRSFIVALIVGAILNLINQGDTLFGGSQLNWTKLILTFAVIRTKRSRATLRTQAAFHWDASGVPLVCAATREMLQECNA